MQYPAALRKLRDNLDLEVPKDKLPPKLIQDAVQAARRYFNNPQVCEEVSPLELQPGQLVAFVYTHAEENTPWRVGVVEQYLENCWTIYTFNTKWKRERVPRVRGTDSKGGRKGKKIPCGPSYRNYSLPHMTKVKVIDGELHQADINLLAHLGEQVKKLVEEANTPRKLR